MANLPVYSTHAPTLLNNTFYNNSSNISLLQQHNGTVVDNVLHFNEIYILVGLVGTPFGLYIMELIILTITMAKLYNYVRVWTVPNALAHMCKFWLFKLIHWRSFNPNVGFPPLITHYALISQKGFFLQQKSSKRSRCFRNFRH